MFRSAIFKLTAFYFTLMLFVCLVFSIPAYSIASQRISRGADNQFDILQRYGNYRENEDRPAPPPGSQTPLSVRERIDDQIKRDRRELLESLILINLAVLSLGTFACYQFARRTLRPIEEAHQAQSRFTADASHELRTPLAVMKTEIEVALKQKLKSAQLKEVLESNLEEVEKLSMLSNQLLALTRIEGKNTDKKQLNLSQLITEEIQSLEKKYSLSIEKNIDDKLSVIGNESLLKELFTILISNAVQYARDSPHISVTAQSKGDNHAHVIIHDEGTGISEKDLPHVFERFYRGTHARDTRTSGHGLGLALADDIVTLHGGQITVRSKENEYSEFTVNL